MLAGSGSAFTGKTIELAITGASTELMNGGAIRAFMTANDDGAHACVKAERAFLERGIGTGMRADHHAERDDYSLRDGSGKRLRLPAPLPSSIESPA